MFFSLMYSSDSEVDKITKRTLFLVITKNAIFKKQVSSEVNYIYNMPCRLIAKIGEKDGKKYLGLFVGYNEGSNDNSIVVKCNIDFIIRNRKNPDNHIIKNKLCFFKHDVRIQGIDQFIPWKELVRSSNGYIVKKEVLLEAEMEMHRPNTPSYYSNELSTGYYDLLKHRSTPVRGQTTFRFRIDNVMKIVREYSPIVQVQNIDWRIMVFLHDNIETAKESDMTIEKKLGIFVRCYGIEGIENWACFAKINLDIFNHIPGKPPLRKRFAHFYYKDAPDFGFYSFLNTEELTNERLGFVKNGSLVIEMVLGAENPFIIPKKQVDAERPFTINNFVIPDALAHLYTLEDH